MRPTKTRQIGKIAEAPQQNDEPAENKAMTPEEIKKWCEGYQKVREEMERRNQAYADLAWANHKERQRAYNEYSRGLLKEMETVTNYPARRFKMKRTITLKDGREIEISQESYDALGAAANEEWPWKPKKNDRFFVLWPDGEINHHVWNGHDLDQKYLAGGNAFRTRAEAEAADERRRAKKRIRDHAGAQNRVDWNNMSQVKWYVCYSTRDCEFRPKCCQVFDLGMVCYYRTEDDANAAICVMMDEYKTLFRVK